MCMCVCVCVYIYLVVTCRKRAMLVLSHVYVCVNHYDLEDDALD